MKLLTLLIWLLLVLGARAQPFTNYIDNLVVSNLTVFADWGNLGLGIVDSSFDGYGISIVAPIAPRITMQQLGFSAHPSAGPDSIIYQPSVFFPGGTTYTGFWFSASVLLDGGFITFGTSNNLIHNGALTINGLGAALTNTGDYYSGTNKGISLTQTLLVVSGGFTNLYTNAFSHGLLVASGPATTGHGPSWIWPPGGGYILWPGAGGNILLP